MKNSFGANLKNIRDMRDMSQDELAVLLGTSKQVISRYETGQRTPKITTVDEYAEKLGVSPFDLAGYVEREKLAIRNDDELDSECVAILHEIIDGLAGLGPNHLKDVERYVALLRLEQNQQDA